MVKKKRVSQKGTLFFGIIVHFFCSSKRNEPKKRRPETTTSACLSARYTKPLHSTKQAEVRAVSGLPSHLYLFNLFLIKIFWDVKKNWWFLVYYLNRTDKITQIVPRRAVPKKIWGCPFLWFILLRWARHPAWRDSSVLLGMQKNRPKGARRSQMNIILLANKKWTKRQRLKRVRQFFCWHLRWWFFLKIFILQIF